MKVKKVLRKAAIMLLALSFLQSPFTWALDGEDDTDAAPAIGISAAGAVLIEAATGRVLFESGAHEPRLIASTTKIMTALVVLENCALDEIVEVPAGCAGVEGSSIYLKAGEKLTVKELLYGMLLESGNDAAATLACHTAGNISDFAVMMNEKAADLGLAECNFENPHGLDGENHTCSAYDLAMITAEALRHEAFCEIVSTQSIKVGERYFTNNNKMLKNYAGAIGVKTGYTKAAGRTLVSAAERDGIRLICVTLNAPDDWNDHSALLDYGFESYSMNTLCNSGEHFGSLDVVGGMDDSVDIAYAGTVNALFQAGDELRTEVYLPPFVYASVEKGAVAGLALFYLNGEKVGETRLIYTGDIEMQEVKSRSFWSFISDLF